MIHASTLQMHAFQFGHMKKGQSGFVYSKCQKKDGVLISLIFLFLILLFFPRFLALLGILIVTFIN